MPGSPRSSLVANLALAGLAFVCCFALLELVVRLLPLGPEVAVVPHYDVDPGNRLRYVAHRERTLESSEYRYTVRFNSLGRRDVEWSPETKADPRNVLFIGDSFVFGNSVDDEHSVPTLLEAWLRERHLPREVFNYGRGAIAPPSYLLLLHEALENGIAARTVLLGVFVGNDFYPSTLDGPVVHRERRADPAPPPRIRSELLAFLKRRLASSPLVVGWALGIGEHLGISLYDTAGSYIFLREQTQEQARTFHQILDILGKIQDLALEHDRRFGMVIFPNRIQVENHRDLTNRYLDASRPNERILDYCTKRGMPCLDLLPVLSRSYEAQRAPLYFPIDRHLNERGNRIVAHAIGEFLLDDFDLR